MIDQRAVYNSEDSKWYKQDDAPWKVRLVDDRSKPVYVAPSAIADTYHDAFTQLFGTEPVIPQIERSVKKQVFV